VIIQRLEFIEQQIASKAREEALFLDEHLLGIRNAKSIGVRDFQNLLPALKWLSSPSGWCRTVKAIHLILTGHSRPMTAQLIAQIVGFRCQVSGFGCQASALLNPRVKLHEI